MIGIDTLEGIDPDRIPESAWEPYEVDPEGLWRKDRYWIEKPRQEFGGVWIERKVFLAEDELISQNVEAFNDSKTQRFGDGKVVARVPLNTFYRDFQKSLQEGDHDFTKWWLNRDENQPWRCFRGKF